MFGLYWLMSNEALVFKKFIPGHYSRKVVLNVAMGKYKCWQNMKIETFCCFMVNATNSVS